MNFIDTHTHLFLKQFDKDIDLVIENAINSGVSKMFLPNISSETTNSMMALCQKYPENCFPMMGLHPCDVKKESMKIGLDLDKTYLFDPKTEERIL